MELRNVLMDALDWKGYVTVAVTDAGRAVQVLRSRPVDLLVSDPTPFDGGEEGLAQIEEEFPDLPIVALEDDDSAGAFYLGAWKKMGNRRTLRRPFRLYDLLAACRDAIGPIEDEEEEEEQTEG